MLDGMAEMRGSADMRTQIIDVQQNVARRVVDHAPAKSVHVILSM
jgi:hypothetical protein